MSPFSNVQMGHNLASQHVSTEGKDLEIRILRLIGRKEYLGHGCLHLLFWVVLSLATESTTVENAHRNRNEHLADRRHRLSEKPAHQKILWIM